MSKVLAVIPARGGSKGIPRKNVRPIGGKPLLGWTIEAARFSKRVERVAVSTDDPEIAAVARRFGAEVIERPERAQRRLGIERIGSAARTGLPAAIRGLRTEASNFPAMYIALDRR